jgi:hypothetical protein
MTDSVLMAANDLGSDIGVQCSRITYNVMSRYFSTFSVHSHYIINCQISPKIYVLFRLIRSVSKV